MGVTIVTGKLKFAMSLLRIFRLPGQVREPYEQPYHTHTREEPYKQPYHTQKEKSHINSPIILKRSLLGQVRGRLKLSMKNRENS